MRNYKVVITGKTPLVMHHDNIEWADFMDQWKLNPENKKTNKAGDDRSPAWRWLGAVYHNGTALGMPQANIMRSFMEGGAMVPVGRGSKTFKAQTQSGMMCAEPFWTLTNNGKPVEWKAIEALKNVGSFADQLAKVRELGFDLLVKRAKIGMSKHIRVRPQFAAGWQLAGSLVVWDEQLTEPVLQNILEYAGQYKGLGDWRPGGKTPGPYGMYEATIDSN